VFIAGVSGKMEAICFALSARSVQFPEKAKMTVRIGIDSAMSDCFAQTERLKIRWKEKRGKRA
jgi:hypothetical protein